MKKEKKNYISPKNIIINLADDICEEFLSASKDFQFYEDPGEVEGGMAREEHAWDTTPASSGFDTW